MGGELDDRPIQPGHAPLGRLVAPAACFDPASQLENVTGVGAGLDRRARLRIALRAAPPRPPRPAGRGPHRPAVPRAPARAARRGTRPSRAPDRGRSRSSSLRRRARRAAPGRSVGRTPRTPSAGGGARPASGARLRDRCRRGRRPRWRTSAAGSCAGWPEWPGRPSRPPRAPAARLCARRAARRRRARSRAPTWSGSRAATGRAHPAPAPAHRAPRASPRAARARPRRSAGWRRSPRSRRNRAQPRSGSNGRRDPSSRRAAPCAARAWRTRVCRSSGSMAPSSAALPPSGISARFGSPVRSGFCHSPR